MLALARALRHGEAMDVVFAVPGSREQMSVRRAGFEARIAAANSDLCALVWAQKPDLLILDSGRLSRMEAETLRREVRLMATLENESDGRQACDFAYYPPLPRFQALGWTCVRTVPRLGWQYALVGADPRLVPIRMPGSRPTLLVAMGDADPMGLTERIAKLLTPLDSSFRIRFAIGADVKQAGRLATAIVALKNNYETVEGADDLAIEYAAADLALCSGGPAAYELAAFGVPAIYLALNQEEAFIASAFAAAGMGLMLGQAHEVSDAEILIAAKTLMAEPARRREMRARGLASLDGGGAARIAADLRRALREEKTPLKAAR